MNRTPGLAALLGAALLFVGCSSDDANDDVKQLEDHRTDAPAPAETGTISGRITLDGAAPKLEPFTITANGDVCGAAAKSNLLSLGEGGAIAGAVVYVEGAGEAAPVGAQSIDQASCQYRPHVIAATAGSVVRFTNSDAAAHNVRVEDLAKGRVLLNVAQPSQGRVDEWTIPEAGSYFVACDYHPWMNAYIVAVPSAHFAVTGPDGSYSISGVPAGAHTVSVWHNSVTMHEKRDTEGRLIGYRFDPPVTRNASVTVAKNATATLDVSLRLGEQTTASVNP
jgi:plastocyanin